MLQIVQGMYFRPVPLTDTLHRGIFYTNLRAFREQTLTFVFGRLLPSTTFDGPRTFTVEAREQLEAQSPSGTLEVLAATSGDQLLDEVAAVVAFCTNATCVRDHDMARRLISAQQGEERNRRGPASLLRQTFDATVTGDQPTLDTVHKDLYRARAAALSMIPTSTGAANAIGRVLPELKGKLHGSSIRVPTPNVSVVDLAISASREVTIDEVNDAIRQAASGPMSGVLAYTTEPLVSVDLTHRTESSIVALPQTDVVDGRMVRVLAWYDNEWSFATRMADVAVVMAKLI